MSFFVIEMDKAKAEISRLRSELAETKNIATNDYMNGQAELSAVRKELAEANERLKQMYGLPYELAEAKRCRDNAEAALEVYDRTFPKKSELELHAALEAANANISDLRRKVSDHEKYIADIEEACNNLSAKCDQEAGDAVDAENALEAANVSLAEAKAALDKLQKAYDESHNENRDLLQFIERMEQEIDHA